MKLFMGKRNIDHDEAFWDKVGEPGAGGCRLWRGGVSTRSGYGVFWDGFRSVSAHRYAYESFYRIPIPKGKFILHKCDTRLCCEPSHLYLGDHCTNMSDAVERSNMGNNGATRIMFYCGELWLMRKLASESITYTKIAKMFKTKRWTVSRAVKDVDRPYKEIS